MSKEIEELDTLLQGSKNGEYSIPDTTLVDMGLGSTINALEKVLDAHPQYNFFIDRDIVKHGLKIKWELRVD